MPVLKNKGPLLVDKIRGYFDRLPPWLREMVTIRVEHQKVDALISDLDPVALTSELKQEVTDEKLRTNRFLGDGEVGSGNDMTVLPASNLSEVVITGTGQVANVTETVSETETHLVEGPPLQDGQSEQVGELWVTRKVEAETFDRKAYQKSVEDLLPAEFRAAIPEVLEQHTVDGDAAMPMLGTTDLVRKEEQQKVGVKQTTVQSRDVGTAPTLIGQRVDPEFNGATLNLAKSVVPDTTIVSQPFGVTDVKILPYDDKNAVRETWTVDGAGFPTLNQYNYDPETNGKVMTQVQIVPAAQDYNPTAAVMDYNERKIDAQHKMRVVNHAISMPFETTYETRNFTFPALLFSLDFRLAALATASRWEVQWTAGVRASFTIPVQVQTNTSYYFSDAQPAPSTPIAWLPGDIMFKGVSYSISLNSVLFNTWSNIGVTFAGDSKYGNLVDRFSISATYPDATLYLSWVGTLQCISSTVTRYKRMWVKKDSYVVIH